MKLKFLVGNFGKLNQLAKDVGGPRAKRFLESLSKDFSEEALSLVQEGFDRGIEPSGKPWPSAKKQGGRKLIKMGNLRDSWHARSNYEQAEVYSDAPYAGYLHRGTQYIKPHKMVPTGKLPLRWKQRLQPIFFTKMRALLRGKL